MTPDQEARVQRAAQALILEVGINNIHASALDIAKRVLAAADAPEPPEVVVTEEMKRVGLAAYRGSYVKPLPAHVRDMPINHRALALHMQRAAKEPSANTQTGYGKKVKQ